MALKRLQNELRQLLKEPNTFFSLFPQDKNFFVWDIILVGPPETIFEGAIIKAEITFPVDYPNKAPKFRFISNLFHPNIYTNGNVCISILHEGIDEFGYESVSERWNPSQSVNSILISILSMLSAPNFESPANVDASKMWRDNFEDYKKIVYKMVSDSQK